MPALLMRQIEALHAVPETISARPRTSMQRRQVRQMELEPVAAGRRADLRQRQRWPFSRLRPCGSTCAPACARRCATSLPTPSVEPVIRHGLARRIHRQLSGATASPRPYRHRGVGARSPSMRVRGHCLWIPCRWARFPSPAALLCSPAAGYQKLALSGATMSDTELCYLSAAEARPLRRAGSRRSS